MMTTAPSDDTPNVDGVDPFDVVAAVCWCTITPVAILTSSFIFLAASHCPQTGEISKLFLLSIMGEAVIFYLCVCLPAAISSVAGGRWILGDFLCDAQSCLLAYLTVACSLLIFAHSLERYVFMLRPLQYPGIFTLTRSVRLVVGVVALPVLVVPITGAITGWRGVYISSLQSCAPYSDPVFNKTFFLTLYVLASVIPSVTAYAIHVALLLTARQHLRRIMAEIPRSSPASDSNDDSTVTVQELRVAAVDRRLRMNRVQFCCMTALTPLVLGLHLCIDLAVVGYLVPRYLVLFANVASVTGPTLIGLKTILTNPKMKKYAKQLFTSS